MASFTAAGIVEPLDYDFTAMAKAPHLIAGLADAKGTIKEPSTRQVQQFMNDTALERERTSHLMDGLGEEATASDVVARRSPEAIDESERRNSEIVAELCSGAPTAEQVRLLPHRIRALFIEWITEQVLNPEAVTGAGSEQD